MTVTFDYSQISTNGNSRFFRVTPSVAPRAMDRLLPEESSKTNGRSLFSTTADRGDLLVVLREFSPESLRRLEEGCAHHRGRALRTTLWATTVGGYLGVPLYTFMDWCGFASAPEGAPFRTLLTTAFALKPRFCFASAPSGTETPLPDFGAPE